MKKWYLIQTKPKQEKIATANLKNQDYSVYCPSTIINNKKVTLFPGYLFINLDETLENWSPIRSTKGVLNFVRFGLNFAKISSSLIDFIKDNEYNSSIKIKQIYNLKSGDKVKITDGVFKNYIAIFQSHKSDERVMLLLNLMGQPQSIKIKEKSLIIL